MVQFFILIQLIIENMAYVYKIELTLHNSGVGCLALLMTLKHIAC